MNLLPNKVRKEYKKKKEWNELIDIIPYTVEEKGEFYHYILYQTFLFKLSGAVVVRKDGYVPTLEEAKPIVFRINGYNNMIGFANGKMKDTLNRPVGMMKKIEKQIEEVYPEFSMNHPLHKEISLLKKMCHTIYDNHQELVRTYKEIVQIAHKVQKYDKALSEETFNRLYYLFLKWHELLFKEQIMQYENFSDLDLILEDVKPKSNRLYKSLQNLKTAKRLKVLEEFLDGVISKEVGDASKLSYSEEDLKEFSRLQDVETRYMFEKNIVPLIRN